MRKGDERGCGNTCDGSTGNGNCPGCQIRFTTVTGGGATDSSPRTSQSMAKIASAKAIAAVSQAQAPGMSTKPTGVNIGRLPYTRPAQP